MYWGPCKERSGSCLKNPKLPESSQWSPFLEIWGRSVVSCLNILVSEPLFWGSGHGQVTVPVNISVSLCSDKKGQVLRHDLPSRVQSWQSQSSAASALRAGSSDLSQPSSLREPGAKPNWPSGSSGQPCAGGCGSRSCRWHSRQTVLPGGSRGRERVTASSRPGPSQ